MKITSYRIIIIRLYVYHGCEYILCYTDTSIIIYTVTTLYMLDSENVKTLHIIYTIIILILYDYYFMMITLHKTRHNMVIMCISILLMY